MAATSALIAGRQRCALAWLIELERSNDGSFDVTSFTAQELFPSGDRASPAARVAAPWLIARCSGGGITDGVLDVTLPTTACPPSWTTTRSTLMVCGPQQGSGAILPHHAPSDGGRAVVLLRLHRGGQLASETVVSTIKETKARMILLMSRMQLFRLGYEEHVPMMPRVTDFQLEAA